MHVYPSMTSVVVTYGGDGPDGGAVALALDGAVAAAAAAAGAGAGAGAVPLSMRSFPSNSAALALSSDFWRMVACNCKETSSVLT